MTQPDAVWLYGSQARGDSSASSDVDLLVIGEGVLPRTVAARYLGRRLSISRYGWEELKGMASYGSLFLHHLKAEARPLCEAPRAAGQLRRLLSDLPRYRRVRRDLNAFAQSLLDISAELPDPPDLRFELATLAALTRRIGILGCYLLGEPRFDRMGPVAHVVKAWRLPECIGADFGELYRHRLVADGVEEFGMEPEVRFLALWLERARLILKGLEEQADGGYRFVRDSDTGCASNRSRS
jgi:predicted nucleotidyltransferase